MRRSLLLTNDFPPVIGGISTVMYNMWQRYSRDRMLVLTPLVEGAEEFDRTAAFKPIRFRTPRTGTVGKTVSLLLMLMHTFYYVIFRGVREIHAGQILACGPVGLFFQKLFGIPCYLWVFGGETTDAYKRSRFEETLVAKLIADSVHLVTNSPDTTKEMLDYGCPPDKIIEVLPAVDPDTFSPGPKSVELVKIYGLENKKVILTVARLAMRKGHDLVLRALALLPDRDDIRYLIVGSGEDRERLENIVADNNLGDRVVFTGRVPDEALPDFYRLCDVYVMPNREVLETTDSLEGFGISFIEANACGRPSIGGRSGGAVSAIIDGVTGVIVDPDNPAELAKRMTELLDDTAKADEMGTNGLERVRREITWDIKAREFASRLTVDAYDNGERRRNP